MISKIFTILIVLASLLPGICGADGLLSTYRDKHNIHTDEAERNYCYIGWYDKMLKNLEELETESNNLELKYRSYDIRSGQYIRDKLKISNNIYITLMAARDYYNFINNENRSYFSVDDIKSEIDRLNYRNLYLNRELLRLKFRIIARYSSLPEWWGTKTNEMLEITANDTPPGLRHVHH